MREPYVYDAFISYRHCELDKFVAENLHKQMEAFKLPGRVAQKTDRSRIERVFRDRDELPLASNLADPITEALQKSEYLIVICSPRLRASQWCQKEIDTFIQMHGREKVFAVLIEGEPVDSFPYQLLYEEEEVVGPDGTITKVKKNVEPLAADVRGKNKKEVLKAIRSELLRLLAPMFGLAYDDLKQRHRERRMRRILTASLSAAAVCFTFGAVSTAMALRIQQQKLQIENQNQEIVARNQEILQKNEEIQAQADKIQKKNETLARNQALFLAEDSSKLLSEGDRVGAVKKAYAALTQQDGVVMPPTAQARYALTEALHAYSAGTEFLPSHQLKTAGVISDLQVSPDREHVLCSDSTQTLYLFDVGTGKMLYSVQNLQQAGSEDYYTFLDDDRIIYLNQDRKAEIYSISKKECSRFPELDKTSFFRRSSKGGYLWAVCSNELLLKDLATMETVISFPVGEKAYNVRVVDDSRTGNCVAYTEFSLEDTTLHLVSYGDGDVREAVYSLGEDYISGGMFWDGYFYVNRNSSDLHANKYQAYAVCYDEKTLKQVWESRVEDTLGRFIRPATCPGAKYLLFGTSSEVTLIDQTNGEIASHFSLGSEPVESFGYSTIESYGVLTRDGRMYLVVPDMGMCYESDLYTSCSTNVKKTKNAHGGLICLPHNSNAITVYLDFNEDQLLPYTGSIPERNAEESLKYSKAVQFGAEHGRDNPAWIDSVVSDGEGLYFICYRDGRVSIYSETEQEEKGSFELAGTGLDFYFGKDQDGTYYVGGYGDGYAINKDFECIARIDNLKGLLAEENLLIVSNNSGKEHFTLPVRNLEELLAMAEGLVLE